MMEQFIAKLCRKAALEKITKGKRKEILHLNLLKKPGANLCPARFQSDLKEKHEGWCCHWLSLDFLWWRNFVY